MIIVRLNFNLLKAKNTHGFNSCIVISVYPLDIPLIQKLQNIIIHNKLSRFKGRAIIVLLTNQSQVHLKGVTKAHVRGAQSHIDKHSKLHCGHR